MRARLIEFISANTDFFHIVDTEAQTIRMFMNSLVTREDTDTMTQLEQLVQAEAHEALLSGRSRTDKKFLLNNTEYLARIADLHRFSLFNNSSQMTPKFYTAAQDSYVSGVRMLAL